MKTHSPRFAPLAIALIALLATAPAMAQEDYGVSSQSMRAKRDAQRAKQEAKKEASQEAPALYPQATRQAPEAKASRNGLENLQKLQKIYDAEDYPGAIAKANEIADAATANAYDKSFAWQIAGTAAGQNDDEAGAVRYYQKALAANGLDNNNHYTVMYNLAAVEYGLNQYEPALQTLDRFLSETGSGTPEQLNLRGALLTNLERYDEAAKLYTELMAKYPDDKRFLMNAVSAYQQADQFDQAAALLSGAQQQGQLTEASQYRALYVTYINADKTKEALAVIDDGVAKGILQSGPDLARDYMVLGQKAYYAQDDATAIQMYTRAASMAADGEAALNLAKIYAEAGKTAEAEAAAQQALDKGVKNPAEARKLLGTTGK